MNPEFQVARFILYSCSVLLAVGRLALWCYAMLRTRQWFLSLLVVSTLMEVGFGLVSLALLLYSSAVMQALGHSGFMALYNALLVGQVVGGVIEIAGVALLVVWLCRSLHVAEQPNKSLQATAAAPASYD